MIKPTKRCECEHGSHFGTEPFNANAKDHCYGSGDGTVAVLTTYGTFHVCAGCDERHPMPRANPAEDCARRSS